MKVWLNGVIQEARRARIAPDDRGLLLADGIYETLRAQAGRPLRIAAHLARLRTGADTLGLDLPAVDIEAAMTALLTANAVSDGSLRLTLTRGPGPRGVAPPETVTPTLLITCAHVAPSPAPARCMVATITRRNAQSPLSRIKALAAADSVLARIEASRVGADDAILLNTEGSVAEATAANLFAVLDGRLVTPPVADGCLPGVVRADLLRQGAVEMSLTQQDLARASEMFLSSALGLRSIVHLEGRAGAPLVTDAAERLAAHLFPPRQAWQEAP
ncbi:aminotransferase class IV [Marinivivus vitaminiproducens]|uniref:aminotransferase class IV n=1 Tax=Marinivivus vitaminiproducens TaxID=3035935 RepID=UPI0027A57C96|nr:aminotransferase class IV [Geminicoccaceae bacterium SCSIO 64248]